MYPSLDSWGGALLSRQPEAAAYPLPTGGSQVCQPSLSETPGPGGSVGSAQASSSRPLFVSGILSMIIIRTLRKDIANYNKEDDIVRGLGWGGMDLEREGRLAVGFWA